jgi:pimeloyl-ACP methyl ester carboxylesterase
MTEQKMIRHLIVAASVFFVSGAALAQNPAQNTSKSQALGLVQRVVLCLRMIKVSFPPRVYFDDDTTIDLGIDSRIERLIVMNTGIGTGASPGPGFMMWKAYAASTPDLPIGALIARGTPHLTPAEIAAYDAPYPDASYKAGAQVFPSLVPIEPDMAGAAIGRAAAEFWSQRWTGQSFMAIGAADPVLGLPQMEALRKQIRGCPEPMIIAEGGHFVQEWGEPIARAAIAAFGGR